MKKKTLESILGPPSGSSKPMRTLGICLGASTVSVVEVEWVPEKRENSSETLSWLKPRALRYFLFPHEGNPKETLVNALKSVDPYQFDRIAATGRRFRKFVNLTSIPEPEAVEYAYRFVKPPDVDCPAVVSAGGETFMVYVLNKNGEIANVLTGNKCASGTGEFFLQQLRRMNVTLDEAAQWAATESSIMCRAGVPFFANPTVPMPPTKEFRARRSPPACVK